MSTWVRSAMFALGLIATVAVGTARAQVTEPIKFTASFPFSVGAVTLPAGSYTVRPLDDMLGMMSISNGNRTVFFDTIDAAVRNTSDVPDEVVFRRANGHYALSEILDASDDGGVAIPLSSRRSHSQMER